MGLLGAVWIIVASDTCELTKVSSISISISLMLSALLRAGCRLMPVLDKSLLEVNPWLCGCVLTAVCCQVISSHGSLPRASRQRNSASTSPAKPDPKVRLVPHIQKSKYGPYSGQKYGQKYGSPYQVPD